MSSNILSLSASLILALEREARTTAIGSLAWLFLAFIRDISISLVLIQLSGLSFPCFLLPYTKFRVDVDIMRPLSSIVNFMG